MPKPIKKYVKGSRIETMEEFMAEVAANRYVFMNHAPKHPGFLINMQFRTVLNYVNCRRDGFGFFYAVRTDKVAALVDSLRRAGVPEFFLKRFIKN